MAVNRFGKHGSNFIIAFQPLPELDGKMVVFGEIIEGVEVVQKLELLGNSNGHPSKEAISYDSG